MTAGQVEHLAAGFARTWQRPATDAELKGLIDDWVREEIATREALALGLDRDDAVIRHRLRQKLEFVSAVAAEAEPTDGELDAYLQAHADAYRSEPRYTFSQIYFDPTQHGAHLAQDAAQVLAQLQAARGHADLSKLGDASLLETSYRSLPASEVGRQFGPGFAATLPGLSAGQWHGPVESGYGLHLVFVSDRAEGRLPKLAEVRDVVARDWASARRSAAQTRFYQELLQRYTVTLEPATPEKPRALAAAN